MVVVVSVLLAWIGRGVYKKWYHDVLEASFIFNLIVLTEGTYQVRLSGGNQAALVYTSVSIAFVTFIGIITGAVMNHLQKTRLGKSLARKLKTPSHPNRRTYEDLQEEATEPPLAPAVAVSIVEIDPRPRHQPNQLAVSADYRETALHLLSSRSN